MPRRTWPRVEPLQSADSRTHGIDHGALAAAAERFRARLSTLSNASRVVLAVSGGPDSMAMLALARQSAIDGVSVATVDHRLREGSREEAGMVGAVCGQFGFDHAILAPSAPIAGASIQAKARAARYGLLAGHARSIGAGAIVTAHHRDDQAETFVMRAIRGSGVAGLAAIRARTTIAAIAVVRPLLDFGRSELHAIAQASGLPFIRDPANDDMRHDRTRIRDLLARTPWLKPEGLASSARHLAEIDALIGGMVDEMWRTRIEESGTVVRFAADDLPRELQRRIVRRAIGRVRSLGGISKPEWNEADGVELLIDALTTGRSATKAGVMVSPDAGRWCFRIEPARKKTS